MTDTFMQLIQFIAAGALLCFLVWVKLHDALKMVPPKLQPLSRKVAHIALSVIAVSALLDPMITGSAGLTIKVPTEASTYPTLLENLRVRVFPVGFRGPVGGDRIAYAEFDQHGVADVVSTLALLETRVAIEVFDLTRPSEVIKRTTVYVSRFVRCQLVVKHISL